MSNPYDPRYPYGPPQQAYGPGPVPQYPQQPYGPPQGYPQQAYGPPQGGYPSPFDASGLWDGLEDAEVGEGGNYLGLGIFDIEVVRCLVKKRRAKGLAFIAELRLLTSTNPDQQAGSQVAFFQGMDDKEIAFRAIKEFMAAICGLRPREDKERIKHELDPQIKQLTAMAVGPQNALAGRRAHVETYKKTTVKNKKEIILPRWFPYGTAASPDWSAGEGEQVPLTPMNRSRYPEIAAEYPGWRLDPRTGQWVPA